MPFENVVKNVVIATQPDEIPKKLASGTMNREAGTGTDDAATAVTTAAAEMTAETEIAEEIVEGITERQVDDMMITAEMEGKKRPQLDLIRILFILLFKPSDAGAAVDSLQLTFKDPKIERLHRRHFVNDANLDIFTKFLIEVVEMYGKSGIFS